MSKWISVKDRLPKEPCRYITAEGKTGYRFITTRQWEGGVRKKVWDLGVYKNLEVTHWMPMPKLPEESGGDCIAVAARRLHRVAGAGFRITGIRIRNTQGLSQQL